MRRYLVDITEVYEDGIDVDITRHVEAPSPMGASLLGWSSDEDMIKKHGRVVSLTISASEEP